MSNPLLVWCGEYAEDGDDNEAHIERLYDALRTLIAESSGAAVARTLKRVKASR